MVNRIANLQLPLRIGQLSGVANRLHLTTLPIELTPTTLQMMWHERNHLEAGQQWLRSRLIEICHPLNHSTVKTSLPIVELLNDSSDLDEE